MLPEVARRGARGCVDVLSVPLSVDQCSLGFFQQKCFQTYSLCWHCNSLGDAMLDGCQMHCHALNAPGHQSRTLQHYELKACLAGQLLAILEVTWACDQAACFLPSQGMVQSAGLFPSRNLKGCGEVVLKAVQLQLLGLSVTGAAKLDNFCTDRPFDDQFSLH